MTDSTENETSAHAEPFEKLVGKELTDFIIEQAPQKVGARFGKALDHFSKAISLVGRDEEMGAIRLIAAEEELVVAIFEAIKLKEDYYPEHKDFVRKFKNHVVKLSFYPVLQQFKFIVADMLRHGFVIEGLEHVTNFTVKPVIENSTVRLAFIKADGEELIRHDPLAISVSQGDVSGEDAIPLILEDFSEILRDQQKLTLKEFISSRADYRNKLLYANDAGYPEMEETLSELIETFEQTFHDLLWVLALLIGGKPPSKKWGIVSQFIGVYRDVLTIAGALRRDNAASTESDNESDSSSEIENAVQIMARADVDYFWITGGNRFDAFEKPIAKGVAKRMRSIIIALNKAGFVVQKVAARS